MANTSASRTSAMAKARGPKSKHAKTSELVGTSIASLNERQGSSYQAIKKFIASAYKAEANQQPRIKKYLKTSAVKGIGGSFKLQAAKGASKTAGRPKKSTSAKKPVKKAAPKRKIAKGPAAKPPKVKAAPLKVKVGKSPLALKKSKPKKTAKTAKKGGRK